MRRVVISRIRRGSRKSENKNNDKDQNKENGIVSDV